MNNYNAQIMFTDSIRGVWNSRFLRTICNRLQLSEIHNGLSFDPKYVYVLFILGLLPESVREIAEK